MRQAFRVGIIFWALSVFVSGCAVIDWFHGRRPLQTVNVQFGFDRSDLDNTAQTNLLVVSKKLRENPKLTAELEGYADSAGSRDYNVKLTQKRLDAVRRYLVDRGVEPARIKSARVGQLSDGGTPDAQAKNRRVTVTLMGPKN